MTNDVKQLKIAVCNLDKTSCLITWKIFSIQYVIILRIDLTKQKVYRSLSKKCNPKIWSQKLNELCISHALLLHVGSACVAAGLFACKIRHKPISVNPNLLVRYFNGGVTQQGETVINC